MKFDPASLWLTGIYQGGNQVVGGAGRLKESIGAYLLGLGVNVPLGGFGVHGEGFYATGDDNAADSDEKAFSGAPGQSYYWSEIMGLGIVDNQASFASPGNKIGNMYAVNVGLDFKPSDTWALKADLWYASLIEELAVDAGKDLGTEIDIVATYTVIENMKLDLIGAYLFAGKATNAGEATNTGKSADPYELAMRLSFSF